MIPRYIFGALTDYLHSFPVVAITGPRQAGKTTLAKAIIKNLEVESLYLDLELPSDLNRIRNPELFLTENTDKLLVIDEVQRMPELFPTLRALVDQDRRPARFLILGSASPELLRQSSETLAGRIAYLELTPFHLRELENHQMKEHWIKGGFPPAFLSNTERRAFIWLENFVKTFIERDLPQLGLSASPLILRNLLSMLTGVHGNTINFDNLAKSLGLTMPTVKRYISYFEATYFVRFLSPWHINIKKRLVKTPKLYIRDSGILHYLAGVSDFNQLMGNQIAGASWEGYVLQQILANLPLGTIPYFYRTRDGAELDLVLVKGNSVRLAVEIKLADHPKLTKGSRLAIQDVNAPLNLIVTPHNGDYPLEKDLRVCGLPEIWKYLDF